MESIEKKGVGINPLSQIHYTDHLAPICVIMGIPLLFIDDLDFSLGSKYYPELDARREDYQEFDHEFLFSRYEILFMSDLWHRDTFRAKFAALEEKYNKRIRHVHCPHGFSDKGFYIAKCAEEDVTLIYGQNMLDMLKSWGVYYHLNSYAITGNYRYTYFKRHREFYDRVMKEEILSRFEHQQPLILYAPTWLDLEESTTFFEATSALLDNLPNEYNIIVKLHPRLELDDITNYYRIIGKYEDKKNVIFLKEFPPVYPILAHTDIYIGDTSSIGYDFLVFNKPMFFLNKAKLDPLRDRRALLFRCGVEILPEDYTKTFSIISNSIARDRERFSQMRSILYQYTFGEELSFAKIKEEIIKAYNKK